MIYLALSCLQGRPAGAAADELRSLGPVGIQLTPGCVPQPGLAQHLREHGTHVRTHQGYSEKAMRRRVWDPSGCRLADDDSVHAPALRDCPGAGWREWTLGHPESVTEVMYPDHHLGAGTDLAWAMDAGLRLAVDVSHLEIQLHHGVLGTSVLQRVLDYDRIAEIHVSSSRRGRDCHATIDASTPGVAWARERMASGVPVVLECYMHKLSASARSDQIAILEAT